MQRVAVLVLMVAIFIFCVGIAVALFFGNISPTIALLMALIVPPIIMFAFRIVGKLPNDQTLPANDTSPDDDAPELDWLNQLAKRK